MSHAVLIAHLRELLRGGSAHTTFADAVKGFPVERAGVRPEGLPYSAWELVEHIRLAQNDVLRFSQEPDYVSPEFPAGYWPSSPAPRNEAEWNQSVKAIHDDLAAFERLLDRRADQLEKPFPWGQGQTLLREALLIADHNSYHIGQLVLVRRLLGAWSE